MTIRSSDIERIRLNETDEVISVIQNILVLLNTWKGSVPMYRDFGISAELLHKPVQVAKVLLVAEIKEAIDRYEPRASLLSVAVETDPKKPDALIPIVEVEIRT